VLLLSRKTNEAIVIDGNIKVMIVAIQGDRVKLGIQAPLSVPVHRSEVQQKIARETAPMLLDKK
jgi:carbon storage regulator